MLTNKSGDRKNQISNSVSLKSDGVVRILQNGGL